ncbi:MAG: radical SAM protein [Chlorobi bacterium]|nr:radical SAM protein [Chlorobiota bacterium]
MKEKILLINPPEVPGYVSDKDKAGGLGIAKPGAPFRLTTAPLDLLYSAAVCEREGYDVAIIDAHNLRLGQPETQKIITECAPFLIGIRLSLPSLQKDIEFSNQLKAFFPQVSFFLFGNVILPTFNEWKEEAAAEFVLWGEPEAILPDWLRDFSKETLPRGVLSLKRNPVSPNPQEWVFMSNPTDLPFPAWHLLPFEQYVPLMHTRKGEGYLFFLLASRGCPRGCSMCPYHVTQGSRWRNRSPGNVVDEMEYLQKEMGAELVQFRDPNFAFKQSWALNVCKEIVERGLSMPWTVELEIEYLTKETIRCLAEANCMRIMTGVETFDEETLKSIGQKGKSIIQKIMENLQYCREIGLEVQFFYIIGFETDSWREIKNRLKMAKVLGGDFSASILTPYPGTKYKDEAKQKGHFNRNVVTSDFNGFTPVVHTAHLSQRDLLFAYNYFVDALTIYHSRSWASPGATIFKKVRNRFGYVKRILLFLPRFVLFQYKLLREDRP